MVKQKIVLTFPATVVEHPFIYHLIKDYNLTINILKAQINPRKEGRLVMEIIGNQQDYKEGIDFLQSRGVGVHPLEQDIVWQQEKCTHCGACSVICPSGALALIRPEMEITFDNDKCVVCEHCLKACPSRAIEAQY